MQSYLVEQFLPRSRAADATSGGLRARDVAEEFVHQGVAIQYVRSTYLPDDETCFHVFEAESAEAVEQACRRAEFGRVRIVPAIEDHPSPH
jgi:hypothetical protein